MNTWKAQICVDTKENGKYTKAYKKFVIPAEDVVDAREKLLNLLKAEFKPIGKEHYIATITVGYMDKAFYSREKVKHLVRADTPYTAKLKLLMAIGTQMERFSANWEHRYGKNPDDPEKYKFKKSNN